MVWDASKANRDTDYGFPTPSLDRNQASLAGLLPAISSLTAACACSRPAFHLSLYPPHAFATSCPRCPITTAPLTRNREATVMGPEL